MKKLLTIIAMSLATGYSFSATRYVYDATSTGSLVDVAAGYRVLIFQGDRFAITRDGDIVVCPQQFFAREKPNEATCTDANDVNRWMLLTDDKLVPGWTASKYQISQSRYFRSITVYFVRK